MIEYGNEPPILVVSDTAAGAERARTAACGAGCRVAEVLRLDEAAARIDRQLSVAAIWADLDDSAAGERDRLLERLQWGAAANRFGGVVITPPHLIDAVAAIVSHPRIEQLCAPSDIQCRDALSKVAAPPPARLHDPKREEGTPRLQQLSEEVGRIADVLAELSAGETDAQGDDRAFGPLEPGAIRAMIRARRLRERFFQSGLFADPAWDMLLDLMAARLEDRRVAVSSLCIAAAVPPTTALRWIKTLTEAGLFVRVADPQDGRRIYVELSDTAAASFEAYLRAVRQVSGNVI